MKKSANYAQKKGDPCTLGKPPGIYLYTRAKEHMAGENREGIEEGSAFDKKTYGRAPSWYTK